MSTSPPASTTEPSPTRAVVTLAKVILVFEVPRPARKAPDVVPASAAPLVYACASIEKLPPAVRRAPTPVSAVTVGLTRTVASAPPPAMPIE